MRGLLRQGSLVALTVIGPIALGWSLQAPGPWTFPQALGVLLFALASVMIFVGVRWLLAPSPALPPLVPPPPAPAPHGEILHVDHAEGRARVVVLLHTGDGPESAHIIELDIAGDNLSEEAISAAVAGVASGEPAETESPVQRVGYAAGWGLSVPSPRSTQ